MDSYTRRVTLKWIAIIVGALALLIIPSYIGSLKGEQNTWHHLSTTYQRHDMEGCRPCDGSAQECWQRAKLNDCESTENKQLCQKRNNDVDPCVKHIHGFAAAYIYQNGDTAILVIEHPERRLGLALALANQFGLGPTRGECIDRRRAQ